MHSETLFAKQYQANQIETIIVAQTKKRSKLNSNLDTRLAHNTLGKGKPKYS